MNTDTVMPLKLTNMDMIPIRKNADLSLRLAHALQSFMESFELVFDNDWQHTMSELNADPQPFVIDPDGTFLVPKVTDETNNWANRGGLLSDYRRLRQVMQEANIYTENKW